MAGWDGDDPELDALKHFGRKAQRWWRRRIYPKLWEFKRASLQGKSPVSDSELAALFELYYSKWDLYVRWRDADEFRGAGYSDGAWTILWNRVDEDLPKDLQLIRAEAVTAGIRTLDDWLRADLNDSLPGYPHSARGGSAKFSVELKRTLAEMARARRRDWPLLCIDCKATFRRRPGARGTPVRCARCLELHKGNDRGSR